MRNFILGMMVFLFMPASGFAIPNSYRLEMEIYRKGKLVSRPQLVVQDGKLGTLSERSEKSSSHIDVIAKEMPDKGVKMVITVAYRDKVEHKQVGGQPTLIAKEGQAVDVGFSPAPGVPAELSLRVTATRVQN